jgi:hypothetical protein
MNVGVIAPMRYPSISKYSEFDFCLAHLAMKSKRYKSYFARSRRFVLLDNGAYEGETMTLQDLVNLCYEIKPAEVVAPDVLYDPEKTTDRTLQFLDMLDLRCDVMIVPQARNAYEWASEAWKLCNLTKHHSRVKTLGVSKWLAKQVRRDTLLLRLAGQLGTDFYKYQIHLLGYHDINELRNFKIDVRSLDTKRPLKENQEEEVYHRSRMNTLIARERIHQFIQQVKAVYNEPFDLT